MGAPKIEKYPIQILSLTQIRVDHSIQSRVETSMEYQREFSEAMLRGDMFPPITVFFDGKVYWLSDGFHRYGATKQAARMDPKLKGIRAEVRNGTRRDAVVFSAGANQKFSIPRTKEDIKKAVWMLLDDEEWRGKSEAMIGNHCGLSRTTVSKHRLEHSIVRGVPIPETVETLNGKSYPRKKLADGPRISKAGYGLSSLRSNLGGKITVLPSDPAKAQAKVDEWVAAKAEQRRSLDPNSLRGFLGRLGLLFNHDKLASTLGLGGPSAGHGVVFVPELFDRQSGGKSSLAVPTAIGRVLLARQLIDPTARAVVVCYIEDAPPELIEAGRALGVEFLTPDELVASLKGDQPPPGDN